MWSTVHTQAVICIKCGLPSIYTGPKTHCSLKTVQQRWRCAAPECRSAVRSLLTGSNNLTLPYRYFLDTQYLTSETADRHRCKKRFLRFYRAALYATRSFPSQWCPSVRPSVCPSVCHGVNCDKTKAPSEKSSIMTNRKSPTTLPMSLR